MADILSFTIPRLKPKDLVRIKGRLFVNLPKPNKSLLRKKGHGKDVKRILCRLKGKLRTEQGQHEDISKTKKTKKIKMKTNLRRT